MFSHSDLKQLILETLEQELLLEGGAGGHMRHPFDIADVKTGADLIKKFEQIAQEIEGGNLPDTKIDGTNTSIKKSLRWIEDLARRLMLRVLL